MVPMYVLWWGAYGSALSPLIGPSTQITLLDLSLDSDATFEYEVSAGTNTWVFGISGSFSTGQAEVSVQLGF
jgi:redox-sensitive bicupin YhaK (pirin superfamily)